MVESTRMAEVQYYSYLKLSAPLTDNGQVHTVVDVWGNTVQFQFDDHATVSWVRCFFYVPNMCFPS